VPEANALMGLKVQLQSLVISPERIKVMDEQGIDIEALSLNPIFLAQHIMPHAGEVALRIRARVVGIPVDEATVARGEKALPAPLGVVEGQLAKNQWMLGSDFSLADCAYCPILNVIEKAGFSFSEFPRVSAYLEALRSRQTWKDTPKLPML
jgi:glutathione S-transferase